MKIVKIRPQQRELKLILNTDTGEKIELYKWGHQLLCISPPANLNKESSVYLALKKACKNSIYFTEDLHLKCRQNHHISEIKDRLKIFLNKDF